MRPMKEKRRKRGRTSEPKAPKNLKQQQTPQQQQLLAGHPAAEGSAAGESEVLAWPAAAATREYSGHGDQPAEHDEGR